MKYRVSFFVVLCSIIFSCEKEANIDVPEADPKIVVNALLEPDKEISIHITTSQHYLQEEQSYISDALVILTTNNQYTDTLFHAENGNYSKDGLYAVSGNTYSVSVVHENFPNVTASDYVPYPPLIDSVVFFLNNMSDSYGNMHSEIRYYFKDGKEQQNFYVPYIHANTYIVYSLGSSYTQPDVSSFSQIVYDRNAIPLEDVAYSDSLYNGSEVYISVFYSNFFNPYIDDSLYLALDSKIFATSMHYYKFHTSVQYYNSLKQVYSNITNGYGIFAGIAASTSYEWEETIVE